MLRRVRRRTSEHTFNFKGTSRRKSWRMESEYETLLPSALRHTDRLLLRLALARLTFSRMSLAFAVSRLPFSAQSTPTKCLQSYRNMFKCFEYHIDNTTHTRIYF